MKFNKLYSLVTSLVTIILAFFIILTFSNIMKCTGFYLDDYGYSIYEKNESIFSVLNFNFMHGGGYIGWFLCKIFQFYIPNLFNIHPAHFTGTYHSIIKATFTATIIFVYAKFATVYMRSKIFYISVSSLIFVWFLYAFTKVPTWVYDVSYNYYRYVFSTLFFGLFWYFILKNILVKYKHTNYLTLFVAMLSAYVIGTSLEIVFFSSITLCFMLIFYNLLVNLLFKSKKSELYESLKFNIDKKIYILTTILYTSIILFTTSGGFKAVATDRGLTQIDITMSSIKEFITLYWDLYFAPFSWFWILFTILFIVSFFFAYKNKELKKIIFPLLMLFSIIIVIFSLILCGKTNNSEWYLTHTNIRYNFLLLILYPFLMCLGYSIKNIILSIKNKKIRPLFFYLTILLIISLFIKSYSYSIEKINNQRISDMFRVQLYMFEKMARFYYLKNQIPQLPIEVYEKYDGTFFFMEDKNYENSKKTLFATSYYPYIYKDNISEQLGFTVSENALEQFESLGGIFTEYELKHICFQCLLDDDFVLNKKANTNHLKSYFLY